MIRFSSHERIKRAYNHQEPDRVPIIDGPWKTTIRRWLREGMPDGLTWVEYFDIDRIGEQMV